MIGIMIKLVVIIIITKANIMKMIGMTLMIINITKFNGDKNDHYNEKGDHKQDNEDNQAIDAKIILHTKMEGF